MDKPTVVQLHDGILCSNTKELTNDSDKSMNNSELHFTEWEKLNPQTSYYMIPITWHSEKGKIIKNRT